MDTTKFNSTGNIDDVFGIQIRILTIQKSVKKSVTYVVGYHPSKEEAKRFIKEVSSRLGTSGFYKVIEEIDQTKPTFSFFGPHDEAIKGILMSHFEIPEANITI